MDLTNEDFAFWSVIESDLCMKIPNYIKNVLT